MCEGYTPLFSKSKHRSHAELLRSNFMGSGEPPARPECLPRHGDLIIAITLIFIILAISSLRVYR